MLGKRGKPDFNDKIIHLYKPASADGCHDATTVCSTGAYHVRWTDELDKVTCERCRTLNRHIGEKEASLWKAIAEKLGKASALVAEAMTVLMIDLKITEGKPHEAINKAEEALSGLSYLFTPQSEWTGGENFKTNPPHIANR